MLVHDRVTYAAGPQDPRAAPGRSIGPATLRHGGANSANVVDITLEPP